MGLYSGCWGRHKLKTLHPPGHALQPWEVDRRIAERICAPGQRRVEPSGFINKVAITIKNDK